jgi:hypothetical protein
MLALRLSYQKRKNSYQKDTRPPAIALQKGIKHEDSRRCQFLWQRQIG